MSARPRHVRLKTNNWIIERRFPRALKARISAVCRRQRRLRLWFEDEAPHRPEERQVRQCGPARNAAQAAR